MNHGPWWVSRSEILKWMKNLKMNSFLSGLRFSVGNFVHISRILYHENRHHSINEKLGKMFNFYVQENPNGIVPPYKSALFGICAHCWNDVFISFSGMFMVLWLLGRWHWWIWSKTVSIHWIQGWHWVILYPNSFFFTFRFQPSKKAPSKKKIHKLYLNHAEFNGEVRFGGLKGYQCSDFIFASYQSNKCFQRSCWLHWIKFLFRTVYENAMTSDNK